MRYQHLDVLYGAGQIFLDPHSPETSPPCLIKTVSGAPGKGSLHKVLPGFDVVA
jgi:hypothetical protein